MQTHLHRNAERRLPGAEVHTEVFVVADFLAFMEQGVGQLMRYREASACEWVRLVHANDGDTAIAHDQAGAEVSVPLPLLRLPRLWTIILRDVRMQFLHKREYLNAGDVVLVDCSHRCNVRVMDDPDFSSYRKGGFHHCHGGHYNRLPARITVPEDGYWNVTLDLGGGSAPIRHSIGFLKTA